MKEHIPKEIVNSNICKDCSASRKVFAGFKFQHRCIPANIEVSGRMAITTGVAEAWGVDIGNVPSNCPNGYVLINNQLVRK